MDPKPQQAHFQSPSPNNCRARPDRQQPFTLITNLPPTPPAKSQQSLSTTITPGPLNHTPKQLLPWITPFHNPKMPNEPQPPTIPHFELQLPNPSRHNLTAENPTISPLNPNNLTQMQHKLQKHQTEPHILNPKQLCSSGPT